MSEIQDKTYTELCKENERLKFLNSAEHQSIENLSKLCLRAANALENTMPALLDGSVLKITSSALIAELRKAAE